MRTVVLHDDASGPAARKRAAASDGLVLAAVLRDSDLALRPDAGLSPAQVAALRSQSEALLADLEAGLPVALRHRAPDGFPAPWECYREYFRSWCIAPLLANQSLVTQAIGASGAGVVEVIENPRRPGWWSCRQQVYEAARAATETTPVALHATPGGALRGLRGLAAVLGGAWLTGAARNRVCHPGEADKSPTDVLFLSVGPTCAPIVKRVAERLRADHGLSSACLMLEDGEQAPLDPGPTRYLHVDAFCAQAAPWRQSLAAACHWPAWWLEAARHAVPRAPAPLQPALRNRLLVALARDLQATLTDIAATRLVLGALRPRAVVGLHLHWPHLAPIVLAAQALGGATLYLQHGIYLPKDDFSAVLPYDELMVFGEAAAESVASRVSGQPVVPVGHCLYDDIAPGSPGPQPGGPVLVAAQPDEADFSDMSAEDWWMRVLARECRCSGVPLTVKLHPREASPEPYHELARQLPQTVTIAAPDANLRALLGSAQALVTRDSTVVIEAALLGVPAVTVNLTGRPDRFPFAADGGALAVREAAEIGPVIRHLLSTGAPELAETRASFIARHAGPCDGQAAARVAAAVARRASSRFDARRHPTL